MPTTAKTAEHKPAHKKRGRPKKAETVPRKKTGAAAPKPEKIPAPIPDIETAKETQTRPPKKTPHQRYHYAIGRRKTAMAKIRLYENSEESKINGRDVKVCFPGKDLQKIAFSPISVLGLEKQVSFQAITRGGGVHAQAEALRHGIARALVARNQEDKAVLKKSGFLTRDPRVKERKKPGKKRARRGPQWSKR